MSIYNCLFSVGTGSGKTVSVVEHDIFLLHYTVDYITFDITLLYSIISEIITCLLFHRKSGVLCFHIFQLSFAIPLVEKLHQQITSKLNYGRPPQVSK